MIGRRCNTNSFRFSLNARASSECFGTETDLRLVDWVFLEALGVEAAFGEGVAADFDRLADLGLVRS